MGLGEIRCMSTPSGNHHTESVSCLEMMPDQLRAVSGSQDKKIMIWDLKSGQLLDKLEGHKEGILRIVIMPNGKRIVSQSLDILKQKQGLIVWDLDNKKEFEIEGYDVRAFTPDGRKAIFQSSNREEFGVLDLENEKDTGVKIIHGGDALNICAIAPNSQVAISDSKFRPKVPFTNDGNRDLKVWNLDTGNLKFTLEGHTGYVDSVAITPDCKRAVSGSYDKTLRV